MTTSVIKSNINEHRQLIEEIKDKGLYSQWTAHVIPAENEVVKIDRADFAKIEQEHSISFPSEITYFYTEIGARPSDLHHQLNRIKEHKDQIMLDLQYSHTLAYSIVERYCSSPDAEKDSIREAIRSIDHQNVRESYKSDLDFLLWEGLEYYSRKENRFNLVFLQTVYETLHSKPELITEVFLTWIHCGGGGGIILNTGERGYNGGMMFGSGLTVEFEGQEFNYYSDCHKSRQDYHLAEYGKQIEEHLLTLKDFARNHGSWRRWLTLG